MNRRPRLAICGSGNAGLSIAADCSLKGLEVTLFELPEQADRLQPYLTAGGIEVTPDSVTTAGRTGFAELQAVTTDPERAVRDADVVMVTVPAMYHTVFVEAVAPFLRDGQILLFNTAFWGSLRHANLVQAVAPGVILADSSIMPYAAQRTPDDRVHISGCKRTYALAAYPGEHTPSVVESLQAVYPEYEGVPTVLEVNVAHAAAPGITLPIILPVAGWYFDRYQGGKFYADATAMGARLVEAYEDERAHLTRVLGGGDFLSFSEFQHRSYGHAPGPVDQIMRRSDLIDWYATAAYIEQLIDEYTRYSWVPMIELAEQIGAAMPASRAMVTTMGIMLGKDYWHGALTVGDLGLAGMNAEAVREAVMHGLPAGARDTRGVSRDS